MSKEALRTKLDALQVDNQRLQAENAKLRDAQPEGAARADAEAEVARLNKLINKLKQEAETATRTAEAVEIRIQELSEKAESQREEVAVLDGELKRVGTEREQLATENARLREKLDNISKDKELEYLRAVDEERRRWEARENRLLTQLAEIEEKLVSARPTHGTSAVVVDSTPYTDEEEIGTSPEQATRR